MKTTGKVSSSVKARQIMKNATKGGKRKLTPREQKAKALLDKAEKTTAAKLKKSGVPAKIAKNAAYAERTAKEIDAENKRRPTKRKAKAKVVKAEPFCSQSTLSDINEALQENKKNGLMTMALLKRIIDSYHDHVQEQVSKTGKYVMRGLCKLSVKHRPALPKRKGKLPGQSEETWLSARKESYIGKATALVGLKLAGQQYGKNQRKAGK